MILAGNSDDPGGGTNFEAGLTNMQFIFSIHAGSRHRNCIVIGIVGAALQHAQIQILLIESTGLFSGVIILSRQEIFIGSEIGIDQIFLIPLGHHGDIAFITLLQGTILKFLYRLLWASEFRELKEFDAAPLCPKNRRAHTRRARR